MRGSKHFRFDENGNPQPVNTGAGSFPVTKKTLAAMLPVAMDTPYTPRMVPQTERFRDDSGRWHERTKRDEYTGEIQYEVHEDDRQFQNEDGTWMTKAEVAAVRLAQRAAEGDDKAAQQMLDRILGKPKQEVEQTIHKFSWLDWARVKQKELSDGATQKISVSEPKQEITDAVIVSKPQVDYL